MIPLKLRDWIDIEKIYWDELSSNPNAIELLRENLDKINWTWLSGNTNAIELLQANPDKINWSLLSQNPNAIELLQEYPDEIDWIDLSVNPSIFTYDYDAIIERPFTEELIAAVFHPSRFNRYLTDYQYDMNDL